MSSIAPKKLIETLLWFAKTISQPMQEDSKLPDVKEASHYLLPSPTLEPKRRIEIYHQQYWWRLLRILQENFPFLVRLFGYKSFNQLIAIPYLSNHLPSHWALSTLGHNLAFWIEKEYHETDKELVLAAAKIDRAALSSFYVKKFKEPDFQDKMVTLQKLKLQSHLHLFHFPVIFFLFEKNF